MSATKRTEDHALADEFIDRLADRHALSRRSLFGAVAIVRNGLVFAMIWEGALYLKVDARTLPRFELGGSHALPYRSQGRDLALKSFWVVPEAVLEDDEQLRNWADEAYEAASRSH